MKACISWETWWTLWKETKLGTVWEQTSWETVKDKRQHEGLHGQGQPEAIYGKKTAWGNVWKCKTWWTVWKETTLRIVWEETSWETVLESRNMRDYMGRDNMKGCGLYGKKNARTCMKREVTWSLVPREMFEMYRDAWNLLCEILVCMFKRQPYKKKRGDCVGEGWRKRFKKGKPKALPWPLFGEIGKGCKDHCGEMDGGVKPGYNYMASCVVCLKWQKQIGLPILRRPP